jgi:hypothetical protein
MWAYIYDMGKHIECIKHEVSSAVKINLVCEFIKERITKSSNTMTAWNFHGTLFYVIHIYGIYFFEIFFYGKYFYDEEKNIN